MGREEASQLPSGFGAEGPAGVYIHTHIKDCWKGEKAQSEGCGVSHGGRALVGSAGGALVLVSGGLPDTEVW